MKKIVLLLISMLFIVGCGAQRSLDSSQDPSKVVKTGFKNLVGVPSYSFDLALNGTFDALKADQMVKFSIDGNVTGDIDAKDTANPKLSMSVLGGGSVDKGEVQTLSGDLRMNQTSVFFKISSLPPLDGSLPKEFLDQFVNKWWEIPIPEGTYTKDNPMFSFSAVSDEEAKVKRAMLEKYDFFSDLKYESTEAIKGEESYKYSAHLNKDGLKAFMVQSRKDSGNPILEDEMAEFDKMLNSMDFKGYVYVGTKSELLNKISGDLYVKDVSGEQVKEGNFSMAFTMWDFGKSVDLEIPADAEIFNPFMLIGGALPEEGATANPSAGTETVPVPSQ